MGEAISETGTTYIYVRSFSVYKEGPPTPCVTYVPL